ncbi:efflux RND transporter periplasmic adaptor subunit [Comamonas sp. Y33R10-2]|uniref:efflux RND transporter periplasmic adaptor subunit n=1 Tax=Comamonas sp. Y33R10-2 TaxID=2853257 RepID=UPI001C5CB9B0|nr:efflux RND transporter periplasmic adaptor subunit [Comamonas sp. Y33R10-2]QXZ10812.1 efflux RND transporter periplasmic adaptor subunit [Comamonas sp. Y33R10-2]
MTIDQHASLSPRRKAHFSDLPSASSQRHGRPRWALALSAVLIAGALAACSKPEAEQKGPAKAEPKVGVVTLQTQSQQLDVSLPGRTKAFMTAEVRPQVSGIIQKRLFTEGALVKQGQPLYQIDAASLKATEASAMAAVAKAEASQRTLAATARRNAELVKIDAISKQAFDESQAAAAQSSSDVAVAKANLEAARINLKYSRIEAPIGGRIALSAVTPGALVTAGQATALTTIVQLDPMYVDFTQSSTDLMQLKRDLESGRYQKVDGDKISVRIQFDDGSDYPQQGKLAFAGVIVNDTTGTLTLRAEVPNPNGLLMPGMYVKALLPTALAPDALLLPQQSVTRDLAGKPNVMVLGEGDVVQKREVELDRAVGASWLLKSGLKAGDRVMVDGFQRVKPGDKVKPEEVDMKAKAERKSERGEPPVQAGADTSAAKAQAK